MTPRYNSLKAPREKGEKKRKKKSQDRSMHTYLWKGEKTAEKLQARSLWHFSFSGKEVDRYARQEGKCEKEIGKTKMSKKKNSKKTIRIKNCAVLVAWATLPLPLPLPLDYDLHESTKAAMTTGTLPLSRASLSLSLALSLLVAPNARALTFSFVRVSGLFSSAGFWNPFLFLFLHVMLRGYQSGTRQVSLKI
jgi:hypothetical protein